MNDLTPISQSGALAVPGRNFFEQYEEAANGNRIIGDFLKYSKGDWLFGRNSDEMPRGAKLVANVIDLKVGWQKWSGGKPVDSVIGRVMDGFVPPKRGDLGDNDEGLWEIDEGSGKPRDPWQLTNVLILKDAGGDGLYTFSTSSKGGIGAIAKIAGEYGRRMRAKPNEIPVVTLESDSYQHPNRALGRIKTPVFKIVAWVDDAAFKDALAADEAAAEAQDKIPFDQEPAAPVSATGRGGKPSRSSEF